MQQGTLTLEYFNSEILEFRKLMGQKDFWDDEERQGRAVKGLTFVYLNTNLTAGNEEENTIKSNFQATINEYNDRKTKIAMFKLFKRK